MFCVALVPVLGLADVYFMKFSLVADHYAYIALVPVAATVAVGWKLWRTSSHLVIRLIANTSAAIAIGALVLLTLQQSRLYANAITLYQATLERNPDCWMARNNLGIELLDAGQPVAAISQLEQAVRLKDPISRKPIAISAWRWPMPAACRKPSSSVKLLCV